MHLFNDRSILRLLNTYIFHCNPNNIFKLPFYFLKFHFFLSIWWPFVCVQLYDIKYSNLILIIHTHLNHHHHVVPPARISLILFRHFSLSFIASGRSSGLHLVPSQSCCMYVLTGRPAFARLYVRIYWSTSLMSSSLLLQQCPAWLVHLTWIVFVMGGRWPYSWCLVGCCLQDLFNIVRSILV